MDTPNTYPEFFEAATGHGPYDWQRRLAEEPECRSRLIDIPTGLGKTAGVVLAWLWNRLQTAQLSNHKSEIASPTGDAWPRRLVYCLPMRTLVEQTTGEVETWLWNLLKAYPESAGLRRLCGFEPDEPLSAQDEPPRDRMRSPVILMGGEDLSPAKRDWDLHPEKPAILIGTQDMLLSRALNRGYGMSRYRWPMHFALLNNDALWVMDEVQLMGPGLAATTQFEGFRNAVKELGSKKCHSWWMSATIRPTWLKTVDMPDELLNSEPICLLNAEKTDGDRIETLRTAPKAIAKAETSSGAKNLKAVAEFIREHRSEEGLNLVVVNTVKRARELFPELKKLLKGNADLRLLHSQFRPDDRQRVLDGMQQQPSGKIVISTQAIEAGVDLSAHTLFTEIAPWSSLVQRFGRCNRWLVDGQHHYGNARVYWFDLPDEKDYLPYAGAALSAARNRLETLNNAAIEHLEDIASPDEDQPQFRHVIRRKDLIELFDTTPDLAGADLDIDRFIRDADDSHVQVFWRDWQGKTPNDNDDENGPEQTPQRSELCTVSIGDFRNFVKKQSPAWRWNALDREWQTVTANNVYPGQVYLLHINQGGYDQGNESILPTGWNGDSKNKPEVAQTASLSSSSKNDEHAACATLEAYDADSTSEQDQWQTIAEHTDEVCDALETLLGSLQDSLTASQATTLRHAARWHDWGKAHPAFQSKLKTDMLETGKLGGPAAKAPKAAWRKGRIPKNPPEDDNRRPHFRHELASALGVLLPGSGFPLNNDETESFSRDLAAYLIAAHHGKVRLSIRSMPDEWAPPQTEAAAERRFARGVWDGDELPKVNLGNSTTPNSVILSLEPMELGLGEREPFRDQPSWAERALILRDSLGPFRLAFLETILRAADGRASRS
ncbi:MAG: CRISPR-associated endonuclease Cas3'' [Opitutales bacterium]